MLLDQCDLRSETRGAGRRDETRGARADDDEVVGTGRRRIDPVRWMDVCDERLIMVVPGAEVGRHRSIDRASCRVPDGLPAPIVDARLPTPAIGNHEVAFRRRPVYDATQRLHMFMVETDRIEKRVLLHAPRSRVWQALTTTTAVNEWFGVNLTGTFAEGAVLRAPDHLPRLRAPDDGNPHRSMVPERYFAFRWHPNEVDLSKDYSAEPTTLVEFTLEDVPGRDEAHRRRVRVRRAARRDAATRRSARTTTGWTEQMQNIARHVAGA